MAVIILGAENTGTSQAGIDPSLDVDDVADAVAV